MQDSKRDTDVLNSLLDSVGEGKGGMIWENGIETRKLSYVKRIASPGSMQDAQGWYTGMTQRDRMRNTYTPMADSSQYTAKPIQCCKVK